MKKGKNMKKKYSQDEVVNHLKATGYSSQNTDTYGALSNSKDFGPLASLTRKHITALS